jgi:hypothetical protein
MKQPMQSHWILREIAEQTAPAGKIDLWRKIEMRLKPPSRADRPAVQGKAPVRQRIALGLASALLLAGVFFFVPPVRAAVENIIQRMGISFVDTQTFDPHAQVDEAQAVNHTPPPSLSLEELRRQAGFPLLVPGWLPGEFAFIQRGISAEKGGSGQGAAQLVTIEYRRTAGRSPDAGVLLFQASSGRINGPLLAETKQQPVSVNGAAGLYVHGGWQSDGRGDPNVHIGSLRWDDGADAAYLTWTQDGVTYLLSATNLGLQREDLLHIAQSLQAP